MLRGLSDESKKNHLMQLVVEASPNGMVIVNKDGRIVLVNGHTEELFGYGREELIGNPIDILVPDRFRSGHPAMREAYYRQPVSRAMGHGRELYGLHKDGHEFPVEIGLNPIRSDNEVLVLAAIVDITERLRAHEMMHLAVEAAPNGMIMTDATGKITMVNTSAEDLFGYPREDLVGQDITLLIPERFQGRHPALFKQYFKNPVSRAMGKGRDLYARRRNGDEISVEIGLNPIRTLQGTMVLASVVDITERKLQEKHLKSALSEKEVLLSEIHHRVKNNLQIIDSLIGMQLDGTGSDQAIAVLQDSQNRVKSMAMIHQTLYQSQDFSKVDIATVIGRLVENLTASYAASSVSVIIDVDELYLPLDVSIPLGLIVNELVSNAFKHAFGDDREPFVTIICKRGVDESIVLSVSDNGSGLSLPFEEMKHKSLGLRLVSALTQQLKGDLEVKRGNPTEFHIRFSSQTD